MDRSAWRDQTAQLPAPHCCPALRCRKLLLCRAQCSGSTCCLSPNLTVGSRGRSSSSLLRGQRKLKSWCLWRNWILIKKKSPDSVSLKNSVKHCRGISMNYTQFLADNRKKIILHSFYEANITLLPKSDKDHKELKTTGKYLLSRR